MTLELQVGAVQLFKSLTGRGLPRVLVDYLGDAVAIRMHDVMTPVERTLAVGDAELVVRVRRALYEIARPRLTELIERHVGGRVVAVTSTIDVDANLECHVVVVERRDAP